MRDHEFELRRRALEAQFQADVDLLRAGYQAKLRALEMLWLMPEGAALSAPPPFVVETLRLSDAPAKGEPPAGSAPRPAPPPEPARRRGQVMDDLDALFSELPEEFDWRDVVRVLGYSPPRGTLYRALTQLLSDRRTEVAHFPTGRSPSRYRKLPPPAGRE